MAERTSPNIVTVSLFAGLAGAVTALLLAPRSGVETRKQLHDRADELKDQAENSLHDVQKNVSNGLDKFTEAIRTTGKKGKEEFEEFNTNSERPTKQSSVMHAWEEEV